MGINKQMILVDSALSRFYYLLTVDLFFDLKCPFSIFTCMVGSVRKRQHSLGRKVAWVKILKVLTNYMHALSWRFDLHFIPLTLPVIFSLCLYLVLRVCRFFRYGITKAKYQT